MFSQKLACKNCQLQVQVRMRAHTHTCTHTHTNICTNTHTHTHNLDCNNSYGFPCLLACSLTWLMQSCRFLLTWSANWARGDSTAVSSLSRLSMLPMFSQRCAACWSSCFIPYSFSSSACVTHINTTPAVPLHSPRHSGHHHNFPASFPTLLCLGMKLPCTTVDIIIMFLLHSLQLLLYLCLCHTRQYNTCSLPAFTTPQWTSS